MLIILPIVGHRALQPLSLLLSRPLRRLQLLWLLPSLLAVSSVAVAADPSSGSVAGPSRLDTFRPVGAPVVAVPPLRRPHGLLIPGEISNPDHETFMDLYNWGTSVDWRSGSRELDGLEGRYRRIMAVAVPIPDGFASFLMQLFGRQWEARLLAEQGEVLLFRLRSYIPGYSQLTTYQRGQFRLLPDWINAERVQQLQKLAEMGVS